APDGGPSAARSGQESLCAQFPGALAGGDEPLACGICDICVHPSGVRTAEREAPAPAPVLAAADQQFILEAVGALHRGVGKVNLARALRGSQAKAMVALG